MRFGLRLPHFRHIAADPNTVGENVRVISRRAEELGYHSVWVGDHIVLPREPTKYGSVWLEALTTLSFAAGVTSRVRLGTSILVAPYRNPVLAAKALASLDVLSGGRLDLGLGTGWYEGEYDTLGLSTYAQRGSVTDEVIGALKALWTPGDGRFHGEHISVDVTGYSFEPLPVQRPHPPIWIGGNSSRAARRLAEHGSTWQLVRPTIDEFRDAKVTLSRECDRVGRDPATIDLAVEHPLRIYAEPYDQSRPLIGSAEQLIDHIGSFEEQGAVHWTLDLFYSAPEVEDVSMSEMLETMDQFAHQVARLG